MPIEQAHLDHLPELAALSSETAMKQAIEALVPPLGLADRIMMAQKVRNLKATAGASLPAHDLTPELAIAGAITAGAAERVQEILSGNEVTYQGDVTSSDIGRAIQTRLGVNIKFHVAALNGRVVISEYSYGNTSRELMELLITHPELARQVQDLKKDFDAQVKNADPDHPRATAVKYSPLNVDQLAEHGGQVVEDAGDLLASLGRGNLHSLLSRAGELYNSASSTVTVGNLPNIIAGEVDKLGWAAQDAEAKRANQAEKNNERYVNNLKGHLACLYCGNKRSNESACTCGAPYEELLYPNLDEVRARLIAAGVK